MSSSKLKVPDWMDAKFQKTCIKNAECWIEEDILLESIEVDHTVPLGENFMSIIYDAKIGFFLKHKEGLNTKTFVAKIILEVDDIAALEADSQMFLRELDMYIEVLPHLQEVLDKVGIQQRLACKCVYTSTTPFIMAMENLKVDGYEMADKYIGLDLGHCKMTLERLAMLHSASMRYYRMKQTFPEEKLYFTPLLRDSKLRRKIYSNMCYQHFTKVINILEAKGGYNNVVEYLIKNIDDDAYGWVCQQFKYIPGNKFNALLHGDIWVSNVMYKYDDHHKVIDVMLLDYQFSNYASVANDFLFFFFSSANDDVREHHFVTLIAYYHECLVNVLKRLGYTEDIPTVEEFKTELKRAIGCGLNMLFFTLPAIRTKYTNQNKDKENGLSMNRILQLGEDYFKSIEFQKTLFLGIDSLNSEGFFD